MLDTAIWERQNINIYNNNNIQFLEMDNTYLEIVSMRVKSKYCAKLRL